jgi:hypothetical protein
MTSIDLRSELIDIINRTDDIRRLKWLKSMIAMPFESQEQFEEMVRMADLSDEDIAAGRTHSIDDVERWMDEQKRKP